MARVRVKSSARRAGARALPVIDGAIPAAWQAAAAAGRFTGAPGTACPVTDGDTQLLLVGVDGAADPAAYEAAGALAAARLLDVPRIALIATDLSAAQAVAFAMGAATRAWRDLSRRTIAQPEDPVLEKIDLVGGAAIEAAWHEARHLLAAQRFTRDLVTEPADTLTPAGFVKRLGRLTKYGVRIDVLKPRALAREGFGALLAVGQAAAHPPRLAILRWPGTTKAAPIAFVGKGITFDTGGLCIKPAEPMWEMRADMAGAAACAGAILALARRRAPTPAIAILALAENAIGANAMRPGDVLHSFSGQTIEIVDTDAEGRLVLADALAWTVAREHPAAIVDLATLTGSVVVALGHTMAGMMTENDALAARLSQAATATGELLWRLPLGGAYATALESDIADLRHCSPERMQPDALQAASFLQHFVDDTPWAHLDIAGMENRAEADDRHASGATGFGVRLLVALAALHETGAPPADTAWGRGRAEPLTGAP